MTWLWRWAVWSNEHAVENARRASTALGRGRVEREEVELFLRERYAEPVAAVAPRPSVTERCASLANLTG